MRISEMTMVCILSAAAVLAIAAYTADWAMILPQVGQFAVESGKRIAFLALAIVIAAAFFLTGIAAMSDNGPIGSALIGTGIGALIIGFQYLVKGGF